MFGKLKNQISRILQSKQAIKGIQFASKGFIPGETSRTFHFSPAQAEISEKQLRGRGLSPEAFDELLQRILDAPNKELEQFGPFKLSFAEAKFGSKSEALFGSFSYAERVQTAICSLALRRPPRIPHHVDRTHLPHRNPTLTSSDRARYGQHLLPQPRAP